MRRGDLVTVAVQGDYGKPRPALVIQSDVFGAMCSRTVLLLTSDPADTPLLRVRVEPTPANGLRVPSWVMIDKAMSLRADRIGPSFGRLDDAATGRSGPQWHKCRQEGLSSPSSTPDL